MLVSRPISTAEYIESTDELFDSALKEAEKRNKDADEQQ
jgi:hypothetical protein